MSRAWQVILVIGGHIAVGAFLPSVLYAIPMAASLFLFLLVMVGIWNWRDRHKPTVTVADVFADKIAKRLAEELRRKDNDAS